MKLYRSVRIGTDASYPGGQVRNERGYFNISQSKMLPTDIALGEAIKDAPDDAIIRFVGLGKSQKINVYVPNQENQENKQTSANDRDIPGLVSVY